MRHGFAFACRHFVKIRQSAADIERINQSPIWEIPVSTAPASAQDFVLALAEDLNKKDLELPAFPDAVVRVQRAMQADDINLNKIVEIISSDPALAARVVQISNSAAVGAGQAEITDVRRAVVTMGMKLVQNCVVSFAMRQVTRQANLSDEAKAELKTIWEESIDTASICYVVAKNSDAINADEAMLTGLLSVIGRLYIFMKAQEHSAMDETELREVINEWHPAISKAIAESWGLSDALAEALEHQLETDSMHREADLLTDVLLAARLVRQSRESGDQLLVEMYPVLSRVGICGYDAETADFSELEPEVQAVRQTLGA